MALKPEDREALTDLLTRTRVATLAVIVEGRPYAGLVPFAMLPDWSGALIQVSGLARHTAGLQSPTGEARFSLLVHRADPGPPESALAIPRVTLEGPANWLDPGQPPYDSARTTYVEKFPDAEPIFSLGDFRLCLLGFERGRYVAGFGRTFNLTPASLRAS
jgi:putative heme iron utilization protein